MDFKVSSPVALFLSMKILVFVLILKCNANFGTPTPLGLEDYPDYPTPDTPASPPPSSGAKCPRNTVNLGVCANVLNGLLGLTIGDQPVQPCCSLIQGLLSLEAAACLCTTIESNILGVNLNIPVSINLILSLCGLQVTPGFQCSSN